VSNLSGYQAKKDNDAQQITELNVKLEAARRNALKDQNRIKNMQSVLLQVCERWWPFVHSQRAFASRTALDLHKRIVTAISASAEDAEKLNNAETLRKKAEQLKLEAYRVERTVQEALDEKYKNTPF